eukprot:scaffold7159_cov119-Isochrysis_galbana.AAC.1
MHKGRNTGPRTCSSVGSFPFWNPSAVSGVTQSGSCSALILWALHFSLFFMSAASSAEASPKISRSASSRSASSESASDTEGGAERSIPGRSRRTRRCAAGRSILYRLGGRGWPAAWSRWAREPYGVVSHGRSPKKSAAATAKAHFNATPAEVRTAARPASMGRTSKAYVPSGPMASSSSEGKSSSRTMQTYRRPAVVTAKTQSCCGAICIDARWPDRASATSWSRDHWPEMGGGARPKKEV